MKRRALVGAVVAVLVVVALVALRRDLVAWFSGEPLARAGATVTAHAGPYTLHAALAPDPAGQRGQSLVVDVADARGEPVSAASVTVTWDMPAMGSMPEMKGDATVTREAAGKFRATFDLPAGGTWGLAVAVDSPLGRASAGFSFTVGVAGLTVAGADATSGAERYTCPMHPSVNQPGPGKCPICGMQLVPVAPSSNAVTLDDAQAKLAGVRTETLVAAPMRAVTHAYGTIAYDESRLTDVNLRVGGWITRLAVTRTGQHVAAGQPLFSLYSPELLAAEREFLVLGGGGGDAGLGGASRERLRLLGLSDGQIEAIAAKRAPTTSVTVTAPASGYVIEKNVVLGASVAAGMRVLRIAALDKVWVEAELYERDLPNVRVGEAAKVTLDYAPGQAFDATVAYVYPYVDPGTRAGRARIELGNPSGELRPGMYAHVELAADLGVRVGVPVSAVVYTGPRRVVFVERGRGRFEPRDVVIGAESDGKYEVLSGLAAGDVVATAGVFLLAADARIKEKP